MNAATTPLDHISTFNDHLARAKLAALRMLEDLMSTLVDLQSEEKVECSKWPGRELRLIACAILRARPLDAPPNQKPRAVDLPAAPPEPPTEPDAPIEPPPRTTLRSFKARFNPTAILARRDAHALVRDGYLPPSFLDSLKPPPTGSSASLITPPFPADTSRFGRAGGSSRSSIAQYEKNEKNGAPTSGG